jgi:glycosyltransferase involved in cell wall biosynthesis
MTPETPEDGRSLHLTVDANVLDAAWGGIPKYVDRIVRELVERGDRVDLLVNRWGRGFDLPGAREVAVRVKGRAIWRNSFAPAWAALSGSDLYWAPESVLPRWLPVPSVVTVHDLASTLFPGTKSARQETEFKTSVPRSARAATRVIAVSEATAADLARLWRVDRGKLRVVGNGVDERFTPGDREAAKSEVRARFDLEAAPIVLAIGSVEPRKGLEVLIEAAAGQGAEPWQLALAGGAGFRGDDVLRAARAAENCNVLGPVTDDELLALYRAADVVAVPSLYEGFGITALEAMACGTPVAVAAGSGGLEEVSGAAALVVSTREAEAWQDAIATARADRARLSAAGIAHAARFTWPAVVAATREVFVEAVEERRRHGAHYRSARTRSGRG